MKGSRPDILVCFAVEEEAAPLRRSPPLDTEILVTGMGTVNARNEILRRLADPSSRPSLILACGFAGGLDPGAKRGTVLHDVDAGFPLADALAASGSRPGSFAEVRRVAITPAEKAELRRKTGADAVDMESSAIRESARRFEIPSATIRVVSDAANDALPVDFNELMTAETRIDYARLVVHLIRHPGAIPGLMRLRRHTLDAARRLSEVLRAILPR